MTVQARRDLRGRGVVPDHTVAFVGHEEWDADRLAGRRVVVVAAIESPAAKVEDTLLVLAETVVVLVTGGDKACADAERLLPVHRVRRHLPAAHFEQRCAPCVMDSELYGRQ